MTKSAISLLNEYCQQNKLDHKYEMISSEGASHTPIFKYALTVGSHTFTDEGSNKKNAKWNCAKLAVEQLKLAEYFEEANKKYKYRVCDIIPASENSENGTSVNSEGDKSVEIAKSLWDNNINDIVIIIKRTNNMSEQTIKTIRCKVVEEY